MTHRSENRLPASGVGPPFVPLWCKSNYSFLEGASHPDELVERAENLGYRAIALTDRNGVYGLVKAHVAAKGAGLRLLAGAQVAIESGQTVLLYPLDGTGYKNLSRLLTKGHLRGGHGTFELRTEDLAQRAEGLALIWAGGLFAQPQNIDTNEERRRLDLLAEAYAHRIHAGISRHFRETDPAVERMVRELASRYSLPMLALPEILYHRLNRRPVQDLVTAIRFGVGMAEASAYTKANHTHVLPHPAALAAIYADDPSLLSATLEFAEKVRFSLDDISYGYPVETGPNGQDAARWLATLTLQGARRRYAGSIPPSVERQLKRELALISELSYEGYFLTMHEIVTFCRKEGILCQGRGSAANSAVCYCLGITAVDPVRSNLLFERFLSKERDEPPDIDLDIAHNRREEVIQHVYQLFGRDRAALVATTIRYRPRSALRDAGKALGLPAPLLERLAKVMGHRDLPDGQTMRAAGLDPDSHSGRILIAMARQLLDAPRHMGTHPGGFLLGSEPLDRLVPIERAATEGRTIVQWDKYDVEAMRLFKVDLLGLGALTLLDESFRLLEGHSGLHLSLSSIPPEDPQTFEMIRRADTVGVFQIESRAQMAMLPRLQPRTYYDLVIEISLVRPGPIAGQMVHPYLRRREGLEPVRFPHPSLEPVLARTLGVPIFQEQVMRLAMVAADYSPGEADQLRRDMAAWRHKGSMERHKERLISRMTAKGIDPEYALQIFHQIEGFAEYGFPESHAASFALLTYATAWVKRHHPAAFTAALLNAQPMGFYSPATIVQDALRHGVVVLPLDIQKSDWFCGLEGPPEKPFVRMGLMMIKGLGERQAGRILAVRRAGPFQSIRDLARRTGADRAVMEALARSGALDGLVAQRRIALWQAARRQWDDLDLIPESPSPAFAPLDTAQTIVWDHDAADHSTRGHLLAPLRPDLRRMGLPDAASVRNLPDGAKVKYAGLVICRQRPSTAKGLVFVTLEDETGLLNAVIFPDVYDRFGPLVRSLPLLGLDGTVQNEHGAVTLVIRTVWDPKLRLATKTTSHDFH